MTKILMFAGSARRDSLNKKLIHVAAKYATQQGASVTNIDLADYDMPIYDGDFEDDNGQPDNAKKLHKLITEHDAIIIASPEYNGLPSPLLKNTIDWVSRCDGNVFDGKVAAIMSASPGGLGGLRGLPHLRILLNNLNSIVIPQQIAIGSAYGVFNDDGSLKDGKQQAMLSSLVDALIHIFEV